MNEIGGEKKYCLIHENRHFNDSNQPPPSPSILCLSLVLLFYSIVWYIDASTTSGCNVTSLLLPFFSFIFFFFLINVGGIFFKHETTSTYLSDNKILTAYYTTIPQLLIHLYSHSTSVCVSCNYVYVFNCYSCDDHFRRSVRIFCRYIFCDYTNSGRPIKCVPSTITSNWL